MKMMIQNQNPNPNPNPKENEILDDKVGPKCNSSNWFPPGFRFHPTDEELVLYYLKRKIFRRRIKLPMIGDVDVYKWQPWELPDKSVVRSRDKQWYFFSPRDRKYPNGSRSNRATKYGYWKATGKDRSIDHNSRTVGNKKTLVYYQGRPPKGQRTDWVMHEYTLDDRELLNNNNNNNNVQDYYALYKLFRKSGPGPKNGEDYGAPFREEEWNDDDDDDDDADNSCFTTTTTTTTTNNNNITQEQLHTDSVPRALDTNTTTLPDNYHLEQLLLQMSSELDIIQPPSQCASYVPQIDVEEEVGSDIVGPSSFADATCVQLNNAWWEQGSSGNTSFQIAPSAFAAYDQSVDRPEVTSLIGCSEQDQLKTDEEFLEIKDFNDQDSLVWSMEDDSHNDHVPMIDELYDSYDYFDAQMYLAEAMGPLDGTTSNLYLDGFGEENQASCLTTELWTHGQEFNVSTVSPPAASGMLYASGSLSDIGDNGQEQDSNAAASPSQSWLTSALSAFLDSVPSSPALASESPLINKALERVSSFRAGRQIWRSGGLTSAATDNSSVVVGPRKKRGTHNVWFLTISFLVGFGAVLWVLTVGLNVKVIKGFME